MTSSIYWLIVGILGVWRVTHLFQAEDGPWNIFARLRRALGNGSLGTLLDCFFCLSVWVSIPFAYFLGTDWKERIWLWPGLSGGAIILQRLTQRSQERPVIYYEDEEKKDVLRQE